MKENKLIAEFIGIRGEYNEDEKVVYLESDIDGRGIYAFSDMKYHTSWDWLMPVVERCFVKWEFQSNNGQNKFVGTFADLNGVVRNNMVTIGKTLIESHYKAVIGFIKWYNENKL